MAAILCKTLNEIIGAACRAVCIPCKVLNLGCETLGGTKSTTDQDSSAIFLDLFESRCENCPLVVCCRLVLVFVRFVLISTFSYSKPSLSKLKHCEIRCIEVAVFPIPRRDFWVEPSTRNLRLENLSGLVSRCIELASIECSNGNNSYGSLDVYRVADPIVGVVGVQRNRNQQ